MLGVNPCSLELDKTETGFVFMFCAIYQQFSYKYSVSRRKTRQVGLPRGRAGLSGFIIL